MVMLVENQEHLYLIQLGSLLENTEDGICVMDANTLLFEYANKNAQTYLGYSMAELRNLTPRDLQPTQNVVIFDEVINPLYNGVATEFGKNSTLSLYGKSLRAVMTISSQSG